MPKIGTLTIASSGQNSTAIDIRDIKDITIYPPSTLTGTVTVQARGDDSSYQAVQSDGSDVTVTANKALTITKLSGESLRVSSGSAEGAERVFHIYSTQGSPR